MLPRIPSIQRRGMNLYVDSIESKLSLYENLKDSATLLELAIIWHTIITQQHGESNDSLHTSKIKKRRTDVASKMQCRTDSVAMVTIIGNHIVVDNGDGNSYSERDYNSDSDSDEDKKCDNDDDLDMEVKVAMKVAVRMLTITCKANSTPNLICFLD